MMVGDVALMKEEGDKRNQWPMGRVVEVHPSKDGLVRSITLRAGNSTFKRPVHKTVLLVAADESQTEHVQVVLEKYFYSYVRTGTFVAIVFFVLLSTRQCGIPYCDEVYFMWWSVMDIRTLEGGGGLIITDDNQFVIYLQLHQNEIRYVSTGNIRISIPTLGYRYSISLTTEQRSHVERCFREFGCTQKRVNHKWKGTQTLQLRVSELLNDEEEE